MKFHTNVKAALLHTMECLILLVIPVFWNSCGESTIERTLRKAGALAEEYPDSALQLVKGIGSSSLVHEREKALYALYLTHTQYLAYDPSCNDSLLNADAATYFARKGQDRDRMLFLYLSGTFQTNKQQFSDALSKLLEAEDIAKKTHDYLYLGRIDRAISDVYTLAWNVEKASEYDQSSYEYFRNSGNDLLEKWSLLDIGHSYYNLREYDKCREVCDSCMALAQKEGDSLFYQESKKIKGYAEIMSNNIKSSTIRSYFPSELDTKDAFFLAEAFMKRSEPDSVRYYYDIITAQTGTDKTTVEREKVRFYLAKTDGDYQQALEALENVGKINADTTWKVFSKNLANTETAYYAEKTRIKELEKENLVTIVFMSALILMLGGIFAYFAHRKKMEFKEQEIAKITLISKNTGKDLRNKIDETERNLRIAQRNLITSENNLSEARKDLSLAEASLAEKDAVVLETEKRLLSETKKRKQYLLSAFDQINDICQSFYKSLHLHNKESRVYGEVQNLLARYRNSEEFLKVLEEDVDYMHDNAASRLRAELPEVYAKDSRLFMLLAIGFDMPTISVLLDKAIKTCYNRRSIMVDLIKRSNAVSKDQFLSIISPTS